MGELGGKIEDRRWDFLFWLCDDLLPNYLLDGVTAIVRQAQMLWKLLSRQVWYWLS